MLTRRRGAAAAAPAPGILAATIAELPELDGSTIAIAGLHDGERGTIMHLLATGVTLEGDWPYAPGGQAPASAVDPRQRRPLARHPPGRPEPVGGYRREPVDRYPHGHGVAEDRPPAGSASLPGSRYTQPGDRLRSGPPCRSARSNEHAKNGHWFPGAPGRPDGTNTPHQMTTGLPVTGHPTASYLTSSGGPAPAPCHSI